MKTLLTTLIAISVLPLTQGMAQNYRKLEILTHDMVGTARTVRWDAEDLFAGNHQLCRCLRGMYSDIRDLDDLIVDQRSPKIIERKIDQTCRSIDDVSRHLNGIRCGNTRALIRIQRSLESMHATLDLIKRELGCGVGQHVPPVPLIQKSRFTVPPPPVSPFLGRTQRVPHQSQHQHGFGPTSQFPNYGRSTQVPFHNAPNYSKRPERFPQGRTHTVDIGGLKLTFGSR